MGWGFLWKGVGPSEVSEMVWGVGVTQNVFFWLNPYINYEVRFNKEFLSDENITIPQRNIWES